MKFRLLVPIAVLALVLGAFGSYSPAHAQPFGGGATTNGPIKGGAPSSCFLTSIFPPTESCFPTGFNPLDNVNVGAGCAFTGYCLGFVSAAIFGDGDQFRSNSIDAIFFAQSCGPTGACEGGKAFLWGTGLFFVPPFSPSGFLEQVSYSAIVNDDEFTPSNDYVLLNICFAPPIFTPQPCGIYSTPDYVELFGPFVGTGAPNQIEVNPEATLLDGTPLYKTVKSKLPTVLKKRP